jgi:peptidoglycan/LPS O-acetylase OafA/YrhL
VDRSTGRLSGLDGLRGLAVAAVVAFHLDASWLPGGFLGVDVFFVISGFLITRILLTELADTGVLRLRRFYARRARRLFPAVGALLVAVLAASAWVWTDQLPTLRGAMTSSVGYVTNWWLVFAHHSYFISAGRPSMLQHLWSLAIEEQYYLVWSLLVLAAMWALARRSRPLPERLRTIAVGALALSLLSTGVMAVIAIRTNVPYGADSGRVYFGTDTHSMGLLLGSAGGAWTVMRAHAVRRLALRRGMTELLAVAALAVLLWALCNVDEFRPGLYRGGFWALDAAVLIAVLAVTRPTSRVGRVLDVAPLRWLGQRSYSIYLWHWPVVIVTRPGVDLHGSLLLLQPARIGLILVLGAASYRWVEQPLRARRAGPVAEPVPSAPRPRALRPLLALGAGFACAALLVAAGPTATAHVSAGADRSKVSPPPFTPPTAAPAISDPSPTAHRHHGTPRPNGASLPKHHGPQSGTARISAYGDSVLLGAQLALQRLDPNVHVDAVEGRQAYATLNDVRADARGGSLAPIVVIHTGDNGAIDPRQLRSVLELLRDRQRVILLTVHVPRDWEGPNNAVIRHAAAQFPNVVLIDWHSIASAHPSWLYSDGLHLPPNGAAQYAQILMAVTLGSTAT